jgi:hypothetical protein
MTPVPGLSGDRLAIQVRTGVGQSCQLCGQSSGLVLQAGNPYIFPLDYHFHRPNLLSGGCRSGNEEGMNVIAAIQFSRSFSPRARSEMSNKIKWLSVCQPG